MLVIECSAYPYSFRPLDAAALNASLSAGAKDPNTPISVPVTGSSQLMIPLRLAPAARLPGAASGCASCAGEPSAAACSASRTMSVIWSSRTPALDTTPAETPSPRRLIAMTVS